MSIRRGWEAGIGFWKIKSQHDKLTNPTNSKSNSQWGMAIVALSTNIFLGSITRPRASLSSSTCASSSETMDQYLRTEQYSRMRRSSWLSLPSAWPSRGPLVDLGSARLLLRGQPGFGPALTN
jgi:hypothetical protein